MLQSKDTLPWSVSRLLTLNEALQPQMQIFSIDVAIDLYVCNVDNRIANRLHKSNPAPAGKEISHVQYCTAE